MSKDEALKQIEELKAKLAELEATVNEPEYKPEDLVGKLCYCWDNIHDGKVVRKMGMYMPDSNYPYKPDNNSIRGYVNAEPISEADVLKMIYKPKKASRYDWSEAPKNAKYMYTNYNGDIIWSEMKLLPKEALHFIWVDPATGCLPVCCNWGFMSKCHAMCRDWKESEEARPE